MAKRKYAVDEKKIQKYLAEGRGQGSGAEYRPWLKIHDFPSWGRVHRILGLTTGRIHHLMSDGEARYFTQNDWEDQVTDIREQFPLDRDATYRIAKQAKIRHPLTVDGTPLVFTTDFLLTVGMDESRRLLARTFKYQADLANPRVLEKFEVERRFWSEKDVDWGIATEKELNLPLIKNVEAVRAFVNLSGIRIDKRSSFQDAGSRLMEQIKASSSEISLGHLCKQIDGLLGTEPGTALIVAKHLIARKILVSDMENPDYFERRPISGFAVCERV